VAARCTDSITLRRYDRATSADVFPRSVVTGRERHLAIGRSTIKIPTKCVKRFTASEINTELDQARGSSQWELTNNIYEWLTIIRISLLTKQSPLPPFRFIQLGPFSERADSHSAGQELLLLLWSMLARSRHRILSKASWIQSTLSHSFFKIHFKY
jgi:hypothetical protein